MHATTAEISTLLRVPHAINVKNIASECVLTIFQNKQTQQQKCP